nr:hypothetical protein [Cytophagales bacterium]
MLRTFKLALKYPKSFSMSLLGRFFKQRRTLDYRAKEQLRQENKPIGWAMGDKIICGIVLKNGEELAAEHFYFSRSLKPLKQAIPKLQKDGIRFKGTVIEHGCGCAKFLHYLKDRFGMQAKGYDVYQPAVHVANTFDDVPVFERNTLEMELENCDLLFMSSYLPHLLHLDGFENYVSRLVQSSKQIIAMDRYEEDLFKVLEKYGFRYTDYGFYIKS